MIKDRLGRHLTALFIAKIIVLITIWVAFIRVPDGAPPINAATHLLPPAPTAEYGYRP